MGSQNSEIDGDQFRKTEWQERQKLPHCQIWKSKTQPYVRIEQYEVCTQNDEQFQYEKKVFEHRRRNPLMVSAYYFQSYPRDNFCSAVGRHSIFLERIPIRLEDVEHVPFPDYLHLFDAALKGYAQISRWAGFFPVEEGMVGINDQGVVKAWLNEDLASSIPFGKATEAQMVSSLIEAIDRNIDHQQLPPSTPSVRNFLYRNADAINFDTAIAQFGEFVRCFNFGQVPIRLECINEAGGVYAIANRDRTNSNLKKSDVRRSQVKGNLPHFINNQPVPLALPINSQRFYAPIPVAVPIVNQSLLVQPQNVVPHVATQNGSAQPILFASNKEIGSIYTPRVSNAIKFTVEVTPGKVYPLKNSTIFMNGSSKVIPTVVSTGTNQAPLLDKIHPRLATSQKDVKDQVEEKKNNATNGLQKVEQFAIKSHKETILETQEEVIPIGDSKHSIAEVILDHEESNKEPNQPHQHQFTAFVQNSEPIYFRDTESIPQDSIPNSLAVSFNPAFENEANIVTLNNSQQFAYNNSGTLPFDIPQGDLIRQTGAFIQKGEDAHPKIEYNEESIEDDIRETGKFNLHSSSGNPQYSQFQNQYYNHNAFCQPNYHEITSNGYHNYQYEPNQNIQQSKSKPKPPHLQQLSTILNFNTEQPQIDLPQSYQDSFSKIKHSYSTELPPSFINH